MAKTIFHFRDASNNINVLQRKYLGNGEYYQRGHFKGAEVGDTFESHAWPQGHFIISEIISVSDSKNDQFSDEQKENAHVEMKLKVPFYKDEETFINRPPCFGN